MQLSQHLMAIAGSAFALPTLLSSRPPLIVANRYEFGHARTFETAVNSVYIGLGKTGVHTPWKLSLQLASAAGRRTLRAVTIEAFVAGVRPRSNRSAEPLDRFQGGGSRWGFLFADGHIGIATSGCRGICSHSRRCYAGGAGVALGSSPRCLGRVAMHRCDAPCVSMWGRCTQRCTALQEMRFNPRPDAGHSLALLYRNG
ncbi:hypothetical protein HPB51_017817 [Rhipicephalus microplus]|uniref:Secreted protein n=1 Tax=Rhipicephalus microplus TaxID=6941 RepID=A0A9J6DVW2_RHIMP|nr:hypothetical protein HPB51_017817 [Rhipicephalus microplus]